MKKFLAMLLLVSMLLALVACGGDEPTPGPVVPGNDDSAADDTADTAADTDAETEEPEEDEPEYYVPDVDAKYGGMIGIGVESGAAYFDNLKVLSKQSNKMVLVETTLDKGDVMPEFTNGATAAVVVDPLGEYDEDEEEEKKNHVISASDTMAYTGEAEWNYYQYSLKVLPADENSVVNVYFCIKDENNYFVLTLGEEGNTKADCYQVIDGVKATAAFKINYTIPTDAWTAVGITVEREIIDIYIAGTKKMSIFNPDFKNQYYDYTGEVIPASITEGGYGAPGEDLKYITVAAENVLHDGKGTWGNSTGAIATMAFDMQKSTAYDCDEYSAYENTDAELVGIPGDGTYETAYVGAYIPEGVNLTHVRCAPRATYAGRLLNTVIQVSENGETWTDLYTIDESPTEGDFATYEVSDGQTTYHYIRLSFAAGNYGNVAEIEFWGK